MKQGRITSPAVKTARLRCAIYTRKSSEEGLDQSFNSLDAQREACEAYIMSQVGEGWQALPAHYDDGGYSGGSMERPALKRLLADIALRKVDIVVVYKVDRLTRALSDFAKIVDVLDHNGASFVSVTQAFNTTSSMGRLTLNVLLSFAQFEREVTGERIRDKIAASKKKGMWMGGTTPLGYRGHERTLVIDEAEAETVRHIFVRYLELKSVHALKDELAAQDIRPRPSPRTKEESISQFRRGGLYHLLANRLYLGEIVHKDASYPGQHPAIIDRETFDAAQALLAENRQERIARRVTVARAPLTGLLFDTQGRVLSPVSSRNTRGRVYRYYISAHLQQGGKRTDDAGHRLPAPELDALVLAKLQQVLPQVMDWEAARAALVRVIVDHDMISITAKSSDRLLPRPSDADIEICRHDAETIEIRCPVRFTSWAGRTEIVQGSGRRVGATVDHAMIRGVSRAHEFVKFLNANPERKINDLAAREQTASSYIRRLLRLAFLAPDIQQAIVEGRQPIGLNLQRLMRMDIPCSWVRQREMLGFRQSDARAVAG